MHKSQQISILWQNKVMASDFRLSPNFSAKALRGFVQLLPPCCGDDDCYENNNDCTTAYQAKKDAWDKNEKVHDMPTVQFGFALG